MDTIQIAISDTPYRAALERILLNNTPCEVLCVEDPDQDRSGVLVVDPEHLSRLPLPLARPERVVLVADRSDDCLARAWDAGVNSVVNNREPLNTAVLAILSARLRTPKALR
jgi:hypothetical protein